MLRRDRGGATIKYRPAMRRLSIARSVRVALLGLTLALTLLAGIGVASLYSTRQHYEDRVAADYALEADAAKLLAAGVVEEATLRTAQGPGAAAQRRRARLAYDQTAAQARAQAAGDPASERLVAAAVAEQAALRRAGAPLGAALAARSPVAALAARQAVRRAQARASARSDSRRALFAVLGGAALALISVLALVATLLARVRRPLEEIVTAAERLSGGDLQARVASDGPAELRTLADAFNAMATALSQALEALETDRQRLAVIIESIGDGLLVLDADGRVVTANPSARRLVADLKEGVLLSEADPPMPAPAAVLEHEVVIERGPLTLAVTAAMLAPANAGPGGGARGAGAQEGQTVWTVRDMTARARLERLKSEFVATASHELRSPLTSIKGFVELLGQTELPAREREFVDIISASTNRLVDLVNDLLDVARVEAGEVEIHRRPSDLAEAVHEVAQLMAPRLNAKRQELTLELPPDLPRALVDPSRVRQIVTNLLTNAHLYTEEGGRLSIALRARARELVLEVSDTGRGMSEEDAGRMFERFYRGAQGAGAPGTGLGLAIVKSLVDLHGGRITVRSQPGTGTTFTVSLPRASEPGDLPAQRRALRGRRVLVVDDEPEIAELIAARLEPFGVTCVYEQTGERAVERLRTEYFDAVTLDILMPGMSGFEVLRTLRADPQLGRTPVVVVSVFSGRDALAGEWVVSKPIDVDELADALGAAVLAERVRLLVVGGSEVRERLEPTLVELGLEHEWVASAESAARLCAERHFEVALVDAGVSEVHAVLDALELRGRRLQRSIVVFSTGEDSPGLARLDAVPVPIEEAGAAVLALLESAGPVP
jgi:signal transduction histidine kinase/DNA-binding NarL/FixJ family response regulator